MSATELLIWGVVIHLVIDWHFQNDWMAVNKTSLKHPAAWVHSGLHAVALLIVFPVAAAVALGIVHLLIDTRKPLEWWARIYGKTAKGPIAMHVAIWSDQVAHIAAIAVAALIVGVS